MSNPSSSKIRAFELQSKWVEFSGRRGTESLMFRNKQDLLTLLGELKTELSSLRVQKIAGGSASKLNKM